MNIFDIKKDINQIRETGKELVRRAPLAISIGKSFFVIIKWGIIFLIIVCTFVYIKYTSKIRLTMEEEKRLSELKVYCSDLCNYTPVACYEGLKLGVAVSNDEKCPYTPEEERCFDNCLREKRN